MGNVSKSVSMLRDKSSSEDSETMPEVVTHSAIAVATVSPRLQNKSSELVTSSRSDVWRREFDSVHVRISPMNEMRARSKNLTSYKVEEVDAGPKDWSISSGKSTKSYKKISNLGVVSISKVFCLYNMTNEETRKIHETFLTEANELYQLRDNYLVKLHGIIVNPTDLNLVLEYIEQGSLRELLDEVNDWSNLAPKQRHCILVDIAKGMHFLHGREIAHRNLSSLNILLTSNFRAKLTGFGLSMTKTIIASTGNLDLQDESIRWLAPEVYNYFPELDYFKADVYSYGIIIWEVLTGQLGKNKSLPWADMSNFKIMMAVLAYKRPELPKDCITHSNVYDAEHLAEMMNICTVHTSSDRPSFPFLLTMIPI